MDTGGKLKVSFKKFLKDNVTITVNKNKVNLNIEQYYKFLEASKIHRDKKVLMRNVMEMKGEVPIFDVINSKFYIANLEEGTSREVKSREDKIHVGVVYNGILRESVKAGLDCKIVIEQMKVSWDMPGFVYDVK